MTTSTASLAVTPTIHPLGPILLGLVAVSLFSVTVPATAIAVRELDPWLITCGRAFCAGLLAWLALCQQRQPRPQSPQQWRDLALIALGGVVIFPLMLCWAMRDLAGGHAAILVGLLPLCTSFLGAALEGHWPRLGFWLCALAGCGLIAVFSFQSHGGWSVSDGLVFIGIWGAALSYALGGRLSRELGGWQTISWALVLCLPVMLLPFAYLLWQSWSSDGLPTMWQSWAAFAYLTLMSQYLAFVLWYRALSLGGVVAVSQWQLLQIPMTVLVSGWLLQEGWQWTWLLLACVLVGLIYLGRRWL